MDLDGFGLNLILFPNPQYLEPRVFRTHDTYEELLGISSEVLKMGALTYEHLGNVLLSLEIVKCHRYVDEQLENTLIMLTYLKTYFL